MASVQESITFLQENLARKVEFLDLIFEKTMKQKALLDSGEFQEEAFQNLAEEKATLLQGLNHNDDEFTEAYENIGEELKNNKEAYQSDIEKMQAMIQKIQDKSHEIQAVELQNRCALELYFNNERKKIRQIKKSRQAAAGYYSAMSKLNTVDPQFMDKKK